MKDLLDYLVESLEDPWSKAAEAVGGAGCTPERPQPQSRQRAAAAARKPGEHQSSSAPPDCRSSSEITPRTLSAALFTTGLTGTINNF